MCGCAATHNHACEFINSKPQAAYHLIKALQEVKFCFGVEPLEGYLVSGVPGSNRRET